MSTLKEMSNTNKLLVLLTFAALFGCADWRVGLFAGGAALFVHAMLTTSPIPPGTVLTGNRRKQYEEAANNRYVLKLIIGLAVLTSLVSFAIWLF